MTPPLNLHISKKPPPPKKKKWKVELMFGKLVGA